MSTSKKPLNKQGIVVIAVAIVAVVIIITYIFSNPADQNKDSTDKVVLDENGEASYLNLSVPNSNQKEDSLSLIDKLEKIKMDSLNKSKLNSTGLDEYDQIGKKSNNKNNYPANNYPSNNYKNNGYSQSNNNTYSSSFKKKSSTPKFKASSFDEPLESSTTSNAAERKVSVTAKKSGSGFFKKKGSAETVGNSNDLNIFACIHTNQTIMNNQRIKFRSTKEFSFNGQKYPINTIIYGLAQIKPNRLLIKINKINQTEIKLEVYDSEDSEPGLYILTPNLNASLQKELKKEGIEDDDLKSIPFSKSLKNIFEKKVKEEKVQLLNNYKVLIKICKDE